MKLFAKVFWAGAASVMMTWSALWTMQVMAPLEPVLANARNATVAAALAYACICLLLVNWRQRRQRARDMQYSRRLLEAAYDQLERRVEARTADLMAINEKLEDEVAERTRAESELRAAQDELVQASKLAALGQMAAGITHELNQPLAALRTFIGQHPRAAGARPAGRGRRQPDRHC